MRSVSPGYRPVRDRPCKETRRLSFVVNCVFFREAAEFGSTLMTVTVAGRPSRAVITQRGGEPPLWFVVVIFWAAFAVAVVASEIFNPHLFDSQDPDSFLRLVQV